jgi:hypothetical protein
MLDLTALEARFRNLNSLGCKAVGGKVPFILPRGLAGWKKTVEGARMPRYRRYRDCRGWVAGVKFCKTDLGPALSIGSKV